MLYSQVRQNTKTKSTYYFFVCLLTILEFLAIYSSAHSVNLQIYTIITSGIMGILGIITFLTSNFNFRKIIFLIMLFVIYWSSNFNNFWIVPICISVGFVNFTLCDLVDAYCISNLTTLVITILLALIGLAPMRNPADGVLSLGFATQSALGLVITLISFVFVLELIRFKRKTKYYLLKIVFIVLGLALKMMVLEDRTMTWAFFLFLILIGFFKLNKKIIIYFMKVIGIIIPYFLTYISWRFITSYSLTNLFYELDKFFSYRLLMWNWYYKKTSISIFPNSFRLSDFNYWGTIDGSYALLLLQYGVIMTVLVCTLLAICNFLLLKYKYYGVFCMMISLELGAFVENVIQFYTGAIPLVLILLILYIGWIKKENKVELLEG